MAAQEEKNAGSALPPRTSQRLCSVRKAKCVSVNRISATRRPRSASSRPVLGLDLATLRATAEIVQSYCCNVAAGRGSRFAGSRGGKVKHQNPYKTLTTIGSSCVKPAERTWPCARSWTVHGHDDGRAAREERRERSAAEDVSAALLRAQGQVRLR